MCRRTAERVLEKLRYDGIPCAGLIGGSSKLARQKALADFSQGKATVSEQRPKPDISWMAATLGVGIKTAPSFLLLLLYRTAGALQGKIRG